MDHEAKPAKSEYPGLEAFSPKQTFLFGIVGGVLILCTIGFFVLLGMVMDGVDYDDEFGDAAGAAGARVAANAPAPAGAGNVSIRAVDKDDHYRGAKKPKVTVVEYSDLECPFCARFHPTMERIIENYGKEVQWVWRHFPLESIHPKARSLAVATECAADQGKFWEFTDAVIADTGKSSMETYAQAAGISASKLQKCIDSGKYDKAVTEDAQDAIAAGGQGTPYSVIVGPDGEMVPLSGAQPYEAVEAAIQKFL